MTADPNASDALSAPFRKDVSNSAYFGADAFQFLFDVFVASIDVIDAIDDGFAIRHERRKHKRCGSAQIRGEHGCRAERRFATDNGAPSFDFDAGAHASYVP